MINNRQGSQAVSRKTESLPELFPQCIQRSIGCGVVAGPWLAPRRSSGREERHVQQGEVVSGRQGTRGDDLGSAHLPEPGRVHLGDGVLAKGPSCMPNRLQMRTKSLSFWVTKSK